ncbi:MAG: hypothetical protein ACXWB2_15230 [Acidimicrobiales bacterium]
MADIIEAPSGARRRRVRIAGLGLLLAVALGVLAVRYVATSAYTESCSGVGVGTPVVTQVDTDPRLLQGATTPREALDAFLGTRSTSSWDGYLQRVDATGAPDPSAPEASADDFAFHGGDHPTYTLALGHGSRAVLELTRRDRRWQVTGIEACRRD